MSPISQSATISSSGPSAVPTYFPTFDDAQAFLAAKLGGTPFDYSRDDPQTMLAANLLGAAQQVAAAIEASRALAPSIEASVRRAERLLFDRGEAGVAKHRRGEAVQRAVASARAPEVSQGQLSAANAMAPVLDGAAELSGPRIVALEIGDLLTRDFPPKEAFLAPWLRRQDLAMVYAKRGVGKTHFCLALSYAVASGGTFLGWKAPMPRRVLYIDGEMPGALMKERLVALAASQDEEPPEGYFRIVTPDVQAFALPDLATRDGQEELGLVIADAELIVLDNLSSLMRAGVENEGEAWVPMATWALAQRRAGRTVLFVHHAGKGGQQRGASRREDLLDVSMVLKHPGDYTQDQGARFEVVFEKARGLFGEDVESIEARLEEQDGKRVWTSRKAEGATGDRVAKMSALGMTAPEIATELGVHRSTVYRALEAMGKGKAAGNGKA